MTAAASSRLYHRRKTPVVVSFVGLEKINRFNLPRTGLNMPATLTLLGWLLDHGEGLCVCVCSHGERLCVCVYVCVCVYLYNCT